MFVLLFCAAPCPGATSGHGQASASQILEDLEKQFAPDPHLAIYSVSADQDGSKLVLHGEVSSPDAHQATLSAFQSNGYPVVDEITRLPAANVGEQKFGIICLSVANGREEPDHKAEMGTQFLMGDQVRILKQTRSWLLVQGTDHYLAWVERGGVARFDENAARDWEAQPSIIITNYEAVVRELPAGNAAPVTDVVMGDRLRVLTQTNDWVAVKLPDGRGGFLRRGAATDYSAWKASRKATPDSIEATGILFLGRPYLWGGNSPKGVDCSGFVKLTFRLNGVELNRNASQQANNGKPVEISKSLERLKKGDLLFFGRRFGSESDEHISHVGIYLGDNLFIQSSQRVRISSLDPTSPLYDESHGRSLIAARRILFSD